MVWLQYRYSYRFVRFEIPMAGEHIELPPYNLDDLLSEALGHEPTKEDRKWLRDVIKSNHSK
jgi:hypothetical protein